MGIQRQIGKLERFNLRAGEAHAYIRLTTNELVHVPMVNRGKLKGDTIHPCINGERLEPLCQDAVVAVDVNYNDEGKKPFIVLWAPK